MFNMANEIVEKCNRLFAILLENNGFRVPVFRHFRGMESNEFINTLISSMHFKARSLKFYSNPIILLKSWFKKVRQ